jgi:hypothetical protein
VLFSNDYIDGDKFSELENEYIKYYAVEETVFTKNTNENCIIISHNSDFSPKEIDLPEYITAWYSQNLNHRAERTYCIPIGLERRRWHPGKLEEMQKTDIFGPRKLRMLAYFNPRTNIDERLPLANLCDSGAIPGDFKWIINGTGFTEYIKLLSEYKFCLCPAGNGIDTHRIWEALYMGCIPIVKRCITYEYLEGLPVLFVDRWNEISYKKLEDFARNTRDIGYNYIDDKSLEKMKFSYWEDKIKKGQKP